MRLRKQARRVWLTLHQGIGLGLGLLFVLLGLTGSLLVFYLEMQSLFDPVRPASHAQVESASPAPDVVLARLQALYPERAGPWRIEMPRDLGGPLRARYYNPPERAGRLFAPFLVTFDPTSLQVRRSGFWGDDPLTWIYNLHYSLLLERSGRMVVGGVGLFMVFSLVSGASLWWPSRARMASSLMPRLRPGRVRRTYDLHVLGGLYSWVLLAVLGMPGPRSRSRMWCVACLPRSRQCTPQPPRQRLAIRRPRCHSPKRCGWRARIFRMLKCAGSTAAGWAVN
jgi:uncharacterized iron-regulated membrane protein